MPNIVQPDADAQIAKADGRMTDEMQIWVNQMTSLDLIVGTGSPEGVIEATVGREYLDDAGLAGAVKFIKQLADIGGDRTQGWVAI